MMLHPGRSESATGSRLHRWATGSENRSAAAELPKLGVGDPGFLVVVKMMPRKQKPAKRPEKRTSTRSGRSSTAKRTPDKKPETDPDDLASEVAEIQDDVDDYDFWPVVSFGVAFRF